MRTLILLALLAVAVLASQPVPTATGHVPAYSARTCAFPLTAPWTVSPAGCFALRPGAVRTLPRAATELDLWANRDRIHLRQYLDPVGVAYGIEEWAFVAGLAYVAGYDPVNRDIYNYGRRTLTVYYWRA